MFFVHLTPQPKIARVKKQGIRIGNGRRGRGVYAVPLMMLPQKTVLEDDRIILCGNQSSSKLWHWLSKLPHRHRNLAAIRFRTTEVHWPARLYLELTAKTGTDWLKNVPHDAYQVLDADLNFTRNAHADGFLADLILTVNTPAAIGNILHEAQLAGFDTWDRYDESVEIVFASSISPVHIDRITPLYRSNQQFKHSRQRSE